MNRELKYRIWNDDEKKIISLFNPAIAQRDKSLNVIFTNNFFDLWHSDNKLERKEIEKFVLMQYTGLVDKNKQEIYEGDIVKIHNLEKTYKNTQPDFDWRILEVKWNKCTFAYNNSVLYMPLSDYDLANAKPFDIEILGNIYQNPELLK